jgi:hypothetical protein
MGTADALAIAPFDSTIGAIPQVLRLSAPPMLLARADEVIE